jgi:hypothetical protein
MPACARGGFPARDTGGVASDRAAIAAAAMNETRHAHGTDVSTAARSACMQGARRV